MGIGICRSLFMADAAMSLGGSRYVGVAQGTSTIGAAVSNARYDYNKNIGRITKEYLRLKVMQMALGNISMTVGGHTISFI